ncbi:MAG: tetratricopeptide repeat protein [Treponema sp.]|jgi:tetratricopeptide (TPR) repeat protein|nr:tetratricopeptide repeat protein [Treponema sp.]
MSSILRKLQYIRNLLRKQKPEPDKIVEETWTADFSRKKLARFDIKSETSFDANLRMNLFDENYSLVLALKKPGCIAWTEAPECHYRDMVISAAIRVDSMGGYGAGGLFFRMVDSETYYSFLISNKSYFRLDVVRNGMPFPLIGWTELPLSTGTELAPDQSVDFSIIAYGSHIVILVRGRWAAEVSDASLPEGTIGFTAASYESGDPTYSVIHKEEDSSYYSTEVFLQNLTVDSHINEAAALYEKWRDSPEIDSKARFRLAETFAAMGQNNAALVQLQKCWLTGGHVKTQSELLLAGQLSQLLGLMTDAENYIGQCFQTNVESPEGKIALVEMAKILYAGERFEELRDYCTEAVKIKGDEPLLWNFQGHANWNLREYEKAAEAYNKAFELESQNGIFAKNTANIYEIMGRPKEALAHYLLAGRAFLQTGNYNDLGLLVPKLLSVGRNNWEARNLIGKWAFAVEDWEMAKKEFAKSDELRTGRQPSPPKDSAQCFLEALLLIREGKRRDALPLLEEAVSLEKDYALFHFRLAENIFLLEDNPGDPTMLEEMNLALALSKDAGINDPQTEDEGLIGWINNFAAQVALRKGNLEAAAKHIEKAVRVLGDLPAVRVNQGVLFYLRGYINKALDALSAEKRDDPEGVMANCAGNLLVRSKRFEEADEKYRQALSTDPDNIEYLCNRASCLMELGLYGEADSLLARVHRIAPSPSVLEMISYVAAKKGEYDRAEQACRSALEMDRNHVPSLLSLGWVLFTMNRQKEAGEIIRQLEKYELNKDTAKGLEELKLLLDEQTHQIIKCAICERTWRVPKDSLPVQAMKLFAMPPDDLPAGACPVCGKTYCIGCAKENLDEKERFICPNCSEPLKLSNNGLKKIVYDWAVKARLKQ